MTIKNNFKIGQIVYLISDPDQNEAMIVYIKVTSNGILYGIRVDGDEKDFQEIEISPDRKVI